MRDQDGMRAIVAAIDALPGDPYPQMRSTLVSTTVFVSATTGSSTGSMVM